MKVIEVKECLVCPLHKNPGPFIHECSRANYRDITEQDEVGNFPGWCPLPEKDNEN